MNELGKNEENKENIALKNKRVEEEKSKQSAMLSDLRKIEKFLQNVSLREKSVVDLALPDKERGEAVEARKELHASLNLIIKNAEETKRKLPLAV